METPVAQAFAQELRSMAHRGERRYVVSYGGYRSTYLDPKADVQDGASEMLCDGAAARYQAALSCGVGLVLGRCTNISQCTNITCTGD